SICVISRTRAFGRNHCRSERMFRRAFLSERRALVRLLHALQDKPADTQRGLLGVDLLNFEQPFCIEFPKLIPQFKTTLGNRSDAAPLAITDFENLVDQVLGRSVSF